MPDKPRKIVVCHPDHVIDVQRAVTKLGYGDVLVKPNRHVETGKMYIIDGDAMDRALTGELNDGVDDAR
jgi:hypothetical protein